MIVDYNPLVNASRPLVWDVPLWGPPTSAERTRELVRAVLFRSLRGCAVRIARPSAATADAR